MSPNSDPKPDDLSPEWTAYETLWSVRVSDFDGPLDAAKFVSRRRKIFASAAIAGLSKDVFTPLMPNKPGFEDRLSAAFAEVLKVTTALSTKHAAE